MAVQLAELLLNGLPAVVGVYRRRLLTGTSLLVEYNYSNFSFAVAVLCQNSTIGQSEALSANIKVLTRRCVARQLKRLQSLYLPNGRCQPCTLLCFNDFDDVQRYGICFLCFSLTVDTLQRNCISAGLDRG